MFSGLASVVSGLLGCLLLAGPLKGQFVAPEGRDFHNGSSLVLEDEGQGAEALLQLRQALALRDAEAAVALLASLRARPQTSLVPFGPRTHVPAIDRAAQLIVELGEGPLLAAVLAAEQASVARALARRDLATLLDHATRASALPSWREAAWGAARLLFERGRWWEAASLAGRLPAGEAQAALLAAARRRLPVTDEEPVSGPWRDILTLNFRADPYPRAEALPLVLDGRPGELLVLDHLGLQGLDLERSDVFLSVTFKGFNWVPEVLGGQEMLFIGLPAPRSYSLVRSGDRVLLPFNVAAESWRAPGGKRQARLLAVDLPPLAVEAGQARLAWVSRIEGSGSSAFGPPALAGGRVFLQVFRGGLSTEVSLAAYALDDGRLLFETPLVRGSEPRRFASRRAELDVDDVDKRAREGPPLVRDGVVYVCTGFGVVAAVDALTGTIRHTFRYDRRFAQDRDVYDPAFLFDSGGWNHEPLRVFGERLVLAPSDSRFLYMLALQPGPEGQLIREDPIERLDRRDIVTLLPGPVAGEAPAVLATRERDNRASLVLLDGNGHTLATSMALPAGERQSGRPLLAGGAVVMPTSRGLRVFALADLSRPPALLASPSGFPPPASVQATAGGLMILHPGEHGQLRAVYWRRLR